MATQAGGGGRAHGGGGGLPPGRHPLWRLVRDEEFLFLVLAAAVGTGGAAIGAGFQHAVIALGDLVFGATGTDRGHVVEAAAHAAWWQRLLVPAGGGLLAGLALLGLARVFRLGAAASGAGIADVMEMLVRGGRGPRLAAAVRTSSAALLGIGTGGSAGREGPMCQLATALAARLGGLMHLSPERQHVLVVAGVSTGLAAAYNAPLAATVFALEVLSVRRGRFILPCAVAALFSAACMALLGRHQPIYPVEAQFRQLAIASAWDVPLLGALALAGGGVAALFLTVLRAVANGVRRLDWPAPAWLAIGGLAVGLLGLALPWVFGNGQETVAALVRGTSFDFAPLAAAALVICAAKILATAASVGTGLPGGVFTPTLVVGASLGAAFSVASGALAGAHVPAALYVLVGMAVLLAGTMQAPFLAVVMVIELTGNLTAILWLPIPAFLAVFVAHRLCPDSIYIGLLRRRGVAWRGDLQESALQSLRVRDIMRRDVPLLPAGLPATELRRALAESRQHTLFVGLPDGTFVGGIDLHDAKDLFAANPADIDGLVVAQDLAKPMPAVYPEDSLVDVNEKLWFRDLGHLPVLESRERPRFVGIVTRRDLLGVIDHEVLRRDRLVGGVQASSGERQYVELPPQHQLAEIQVPRGLAGRTLAELDLTARYGITVLAAVRQGPNGTEERQAPSAGYRFQQGDRMVVLGTAAAIESLREKF